MKWEFVSETDPEVTEALEKELWRQENHLELIASENYTSRAVLEASEVDLPLPVGPVRRTSPL